MVTRLPIRPLLFVLGILIGVAAIASWVITGCACAGTSKSGGRHAASAPVNTRPVDSGSSTAGNNRLPHLACHTLAGTVYGNGGVAYFSGDLRRVQFAVDLHTRCYLYYLNPVEVTVHDLPGYGYSVGPLTVVSPPAPHVAPTAHRGEDGLPETDVVVTYLGRRFWIVLNQFERHGPGRVWAIITITPY